MKYLIGIGILVAFVSVVTAQDKVDVKVADAFIAEDTGVIYATSPTNFDEMLRVIPKIKKGIEGAKDLTALGKKIGFLKKGQDFIVVEVKDTQIKGIQRIKTVIPIEDSEITVYIASVQFDPKLKLLKTQD